MTHGAERRRRLVNRAPNPKGNPEQQIYDYGWRRGYLQGVRDAMQDPEKVAGGSRLAKMMTVPDHVMCDPRRAVSTVQGKWRGEEAFLVCGGPSLRGIDLHTLLAGKHTLSVNRVPLKSGWWPDYLIVNDLHVWKWYEKRFKEGGRHPCCMLVSQPSAFYEYEIPEGLWYRPEAVPENLVQTRETLFMHSTVATVGIHFAWLLGVSRLYLLGLDGYVHEDRHYFWDEKVQDEVYSQGELLLQRKMQTWHKDMVTLEAYFKRHNYSIDVVNLSAKSQIGVWPKGNMEEVFGDAYATVGQSELPPSVEGSSGEDRTGTGPIQVSGVLDRPGSPGVSFQEPLPDEAGGGSDVGDQGDGDRRAEGVDSGSGSLEPRLVPDVHSPPVRGAADDREPE